MGKAIFPPDRTCACMDVCVEMAVLLGSLYTNQTVSGSVLVHGTLGKVWGSDEQWGTEELLMRKEQKLEQTELSSERY